MADDPQASRSGRTVAHVGARAGTFMQYVGAALSLTLIAGVGVWGYKLLVRDVTGIPVVRAMEGPMRAAPEHPGGDVALHAGLAVNAVAAVGEAAPPEDRLVLAPPQVELTPEDLVAAPREVAVTVGPLPEDGTVTDAMTEEPRLDGDAAAPPTLAEAASQPPSLPEAEPAPLTADEVLALAEQIAAGASAGFRPDPDPQVQETAVSEAAASEDDASVAEAVEPESFELAASIPGVARSPRPPLRPTALFAATVTTATPGQAAQIVAARATPVSISTAQIAAGTSLVQLGAFESAEVAGQEWDRLRGRFAAFLSGKERVIQKAESGGRTFYRLRAMGFADIGDARRFCSALIAEDAACIPVLVR